MQNLLNSYQDIDSNRYWQLLAMSSQVMKIINIDVQGSPSLPVNWKINKTHAKHSHFAIQMNQDKTSTVVQSGLQ